MDVPTGKFYVDVEQWDTYELDLKEEIVKIISAYRRAEYQDAQVSLYASRTGAELASFGAINGVTVTPLSAR